MLPQSLAIQANSSYGNAGSFAEKIGASTHPTLQWLRIWKSNQEAWQVTHQEWQSPNLVHAYRDQLESSTPGLIAQLKGVPTKARYHAATIFMDHCSGLGFVYLQHTLSSEETVQAKHAFETFATSHGVTIRHYHTDNGCFQGKAYHQ